MSIVDWFFVIAAAVTLFGAWRVVISEKIMHAALWLALTFAGVAAIFFLLGADFLAAAQLLVYVGAITTVIIFGIMLSSVEDLRGGPEGSFWQRISAQFATPRRGILALVAAGGLGLSLIVLIAGGAWRSARPESLVPADTPAMIGRALFETYVIPFEIASAVLLVALVGAIVLATKEESPTPNGEERPE